MLRDVGVFVASGIALGILVLGAWRVSTKEERDFEGSRSYRLLEDINNVRGIVGLCVQCDKLPMKDGALDPYHFVRTGDIAPEQFKVLRSNLLGIGPTEDEVRRGDYTNFPWERYRGERADLGRPFFPLLWGRVNEKGWTLVGFSDGRVEMLERDRLEKWGLDR